MDDSANPPAASPDSLKKKFKKSLCYSCCFRRRHLPLDSPSPSDNPGLIWVKAKDHSLSEIKDKCRAVLGISGGRHRRSSSPEFTYDPLSYALNFEDGFDFDGGAPLKNFTSPPVPTAVN